MNQSNYENIKGLILAGGKSLRMQKDKAMLNYHGVPQSEYAWGQLNSLGLQTYLSVNQARETALPQLVDSYGSTGPISGILTAFDHDPNSAWLVIGCDYPLLSQSDLIRLLNQRDSNRIATAFFSEEAQRYIPTLCIFEPQSGGLLRQAYKEGKYSVHSILLARQAKKLLPENPKTLQSVDTPEVFERIKKVIDERS